MNLISLMQKVIGFFFIECIPLMTVSAPANLTASDLTSIWWYDLKSWSGGWKRPAAGHQEKRKKVHFFYLILPFSWENPLSLNVIFTKYAAVIIGHTAADCLLLENIISISQKVPWRKHWKLNKIHPVIILFLGNIYYHVDSFWKRVNIAEQN